MANFLGGGFKKLYSNLGYNNWTSITIVIATLKSFKLAKTSEKWENIFYDITIANSFTDFLQNFSLPLTKQAKIVILQYNSSWLSLLESVIWFPKQDNQNCLLRKTRYLGCGIFFQIHLWTNSSISHLQACLSACQGSATAFIRKIYKFVFFILKWPKRSFFGGSRRVWSIFQGTF